jgi:hypothetical protein
MHRKAVILAAAITLLASLALAGDGVRWLNVHVTDAKDHTEVKLHLPYALVLTVIDSVKSDRFLAGKVKLDLEGCRVDWPAVLQALKLAPEGDYLTVHENGADISFKKHAGTVAVDIAQAGDDHAVVKMRLPVALLAAVSVDDHNRLDVRALAAQLERIETGELLRVTSDDAKVTVWVE